MHMIEPCCAQRQMNDLRKALKGGGRDEVRGYGDMSLTELLPALLTGYNETELLIAAPTIPDQAADIIEKWAKWQWARMDGKGKIDVLTRLTIIADLSAEQSPKASEWLKENPFAGRLTLADKPVAADQQALLLPDLAVLGPLNLRYGANFTCTVTTIQEEVGALWKQYARMTRPKVKAAAKKAAEEQEENDARISSTERERLRVGEHSEGMQARPEVKAAEEEDDKPADGQPESPSVAQETENPAMP